MKPLFLFLLAPFSAAVTFVLVGWAAGGLLATWASFCVFFLGFYPFQANLESRRQFAADRRGRLPFWRFALASVVGGSVIALFFYQWTMSQSR